MTSESSRWLTDEEINAAFDGAFDKPIEFDHKPTPEEIITIRLRAVADKVISLYKEAQDD